MADSHEKIDASEKITDTHRTQSKAEDKKTESTGKRYDPASLRANMATGGGTPIPKGHKRTTEKRVMQPRDPDTGHFTYNADAELSLKYKSHGKGNADPVALRRMTLNGDIKKGDVVNWGESTFIAIEDIDARKIKDFLRHYDPETGEFYSYGTDGIDFNAMGKAKQIREGFTEINGKVLANKLSDLFVKKQGRMAKSEKEGIEQGDKRVVGHVDLDKVGDRTKNEVASKLASYKAGFYPKWQADSIMAPSLDPQQLAKNQAHNKNAAAFGGGKSQPSQPMAATPTGGNPTSFKSGSVPSFGPKTQKKQYNNVISFRKGSSPSKQDLLDDFDDEE